MVYMGMFFLKKVFIEVFGKYWGQAKYVLFLFCSARNNLLSLAKI
jgi:hypothetical protein